MNIDYSLIKEKLDGLEIKKIPKTFLQVISRPLDEVVISKYLAYLLDERNTTKQIVKEILTATQKGTTNFAEMLEGATLEDIETEYYIDQHNRLDIIIKYDTFWIVIENKVMALESKEKQTSTYEKEIKKINDKNLPVKYIYLKPNYNKSKPSNTNFAEFCYDDLIKILNHINKNELADKESYGFMRDFIKHSEEFLMKQSITKCDESALDFYLSNKDKLDYLIANYRTQCLKVKEMLIESIKKEFPEPEFYIFPSTGYIQIYKATWGWTNSAHAGIHYEILTDKSDDINFGSLIGNKSVKIKYAIHNEGKTKSIYTNIKTGTLFARAYPFNNNQNIAESIKKIINELKNIKEQNTDKIDKEIEENKTMKKTN